MNDGDAIWKCVIEEGGPISIYADWMAENGLEEESGMYRGGVRIIRYGFLSTAGTQSVLIADLMPQEPIVVTGVTGLVAVKAHSVYDSIVSI